MPRRIRSNSVAVNSNDPASPPCRSSVGTSAGLGVGGRLLLVLAVVARPVLAPEEPVDGEHDHQRRDQPEQRARRAGTAGDDAWRSSTFAWSRSSSRRRAFSSPVIFARPCPDATVIPPVEAKAERGTSARSSTNWSAGTSSARSRTGCRRAERRHGRTPGCPRRERPGPARSGSTVSLPSPVFHSSPQTFRLTSTTSS